MLRQTESAIRMLLGAYRAILFRADPSADRHLRLLSVLKAALLCPVLAGLLCAGTAEAAAFAPIYSGDALILNTEAFNNICQNSLFSGQNVKLSELFKGFSSGSWQGKLDDWTAPEGWENAGTLTIVGYDPDNKYFSGGYNPYPDVDYLGLQNRKFILTMDKLTEQSSKVPDIKFINMPILGSSEQSHSGMVGFSGAGNNFYASIDISTISLDSSKTADINKFKYFTKGVIWNEDASDNKVTDTKKDPLFATIKITGFDNIFLNNNLNLKTSTDLNKKSQGIDTTNSILGGFGVLGVQNEQGKITASNRDKVNSLEQAKNQDNYNVYLQANNNLIITTAIDSAVKLQRDHLGVLEATSGNLILATQVPDSAKTQCGTDSKSPVYGLNNAVEVDLGSVLHLVSYSGDVIIKGHVDVNPHRITNASDKNKNYPNSNTRMFVYGNDISICADGTGYNNMSDFHDYYEYGALSVDLGGEYSSAASGTNIIMAKGIAGIYASGKAEQAKDAADNPTNTTKVTLTGKNNYIEAAFSQQNEAEKESAHKEPVNPSVHNINKSVIGLDIRAGALVNVSGSDSNTIYSDDRGVVIRDSGSYLHLVAGTAASSADQASMFSSDIAGGSDDFTGNRLQAASGNGLTVSNKAEATVTGPRNIVSAGGTGIQLSSGSNTSFTADLTSATGINQVTAGLNDKAGSRNGLDIDASTLSFSGHSNIISAGIKSEGDNSRNGTLTLATGQDNSAITGLRAVEQAKASLTGAVSNIIKSAGSGIVAAGSGSTVQLQQGTAGSSIVPFAAGEPETSFSGNFVAGLSGTAVDARDSAAVTLAGQSNQLSAGKLGILSSGAATVNLEGAVSNLIDSDGSGISAAGSGSKVTLTQQSTGLAFRRAALLQDSQAGNFISATAGTGIEVQDQAAVSLSGDLNSVQAGEQGILASGGSTVSLDSHTFNQLLSSGGGIKASGTDSKVTLSASSGLQRNFSLLATDDAEAAVKNAVNSIIATGGTGIEAGSGAEVILTGKTNAVRSSGTAIVVSGQSSSVVLQKQQSTFAYRAGLKAALSADTPQPGYDSGDNILISDHDGIIEASQSGSVTLTGSNNLLEGGTFGVRAQASAVTLTASGQTGQNGIWAHSGAGVTAESGAQVKMSGKTNLVSAQDTALSVSGPDSAITLHKEQIQQQSFLRRPALLAAGEEVPDKPSTPEYAGSDNMLFSSQGGALKADNSGRAVLSGSSNYLQSNTFGVQVSDGASVTLSAGAAEDQGNSIVVQHGSAVSTAGKGSSTKLSGRITYLYAGTQGKAAASVQTFSHQPAPAVPEESAPGSVAGLSVSSGAVTQVKADGLYIMSGPRSFSGTSQAHDHSDDSRKIIDLSKVQAEYYGVKVTDGASLTLQNLTADSTEPGTGGESGEPEPQARPVAMAADTADPSYTKASQNSFIQSDGIGVYVDRASLQVEQKENHVIRAGNTHYVEAEDCELGHALTEWRTLLSPASGYEYNDKVNTTNAALLSRINITGEDRNLLLGDSLAIFSLYDPNEQGITQGSVIPQPELSGAVWQQENGGEAGAGGEESGTSSQNRPLHWQARTSNYLSGAVIARNLKKNDSSKPVLQADGTDNPSGTETPDSGEDNETERSNNIVIESMNGDNFILSSAKVDLSQIAADTDGYDETTGGDKSKYQVKTAVMAIGEQSRVDIINHNPEGWNFIMTDATGSREDGSSEHEHVVRAYRGGRVNIEGNTFISANADYDDQGYISRDNGLGLALITGMAKEKYDISSTITVNADKPAHATANEDGYYEGFATYIFGDVAAGRNGVIKISNEKNTAATYIRGNVLAANGGKVDLNLGENGIWIGRGDDYGDATRGKGDGEFYNPAFSNTIEQGGTLNVVMGRDAKWYLTGQSWISSLKATGNADIYMSRGDADNITYSLLINTLQAGEGEPTFHMSLNHDNHAQSDMLYIRNIEKAGTYHIDIVGDIPALDTVSYDKPLRLATFRLTAGTAGTDADNPFTPTATFNGNGVNDLELPLSVIEHDRDGRNDEYNGDSLDTSKPGEEVLDGFFFSDSQAEKPEEPEEPDTHAEQKAQKAKQDKQDKQSVQSKRPAKAQGQRPGMPAARSNAATGSTQGRANADTNSGTSSASAKDEQLRDVVIQRLPDGYFDGDYDNDHDHGGGSGDADDDNGGNHGSATLSDSGKTILNMSRANYANAVYLDTLNKRQGEARFTGAQDDGVWVRLRYDNIGKESSFRSHNTMVEVGFDRRQAVQGGVWHYGLALDYMDGSIDYQMVNGDGDLTRYGAWLYGTYLADNGCYLDLVGKYGHLENDFEFRNKYKGDMVTGSFSNEVWSLSAEAGRKFSNRKQWFFEPQAQLQYSYVSSADYTTSQQTRVQLDAIDSLIGRLGFRAGHDFSAQEYPVSLYVRADVMHEFMGEQRVQARDITGYRDMTFYNEDTWYSAGLGIATRSSENTYIFLEAEQVFGADNESTYTISGGFRHTF